MITSQIKTAARISHNALDTEIVALENYARAELIRLGVPEFIANADDEPLITEAVKAYALSQILDEHTERYTESWIYQCDNLRNHSWY